MAAKVRRVNFSPDEFLIGVRDIKRADWAWCYWVVCCLVYSKGGPIEDDSGWIAKAAMVDVRTWHAARRALLMMGKLVAFHDDRVPYITNDRAEMELWLARHRIETASRGGKARSGNRQDDLTGSSQDRGRIAAGSGTPFQTFQRVRRPISGANHQPLKITKSLTVAARASPAVWKTRIAGFDLGYWDAVEWGPPPDSGHCEAPDFILKAWQQNRGTK